MQPFRSRRVPPPRKPGRWVSVDQMLSEVEELQGRPKPPRPRLVRGYVVPLRTTVPEQPAPDAQEDGA